MTLQQIEFETIDQPANLRIVGQQFAAGKSLWRSFTNERVRQIRLQEPILDLGAGELGTSSYHTGIPGFSTAQVYSVDLAATRKPTKVADIEQGIPFEAEFFRTCVAFNLFEHLFDYHKVLLEIRRVLQPDGRLYIAVPFLLRVHGDPCDYFRYTGYAIQRSLSRAGYDKIQIAPCGGGAVTAALAQVDFLIPRPARRAALRFALDLDRQISKRSGGVHRNANDYPLGYFIAARRPG